MLCKCCKNATSEGEPLCKACYDRFQSFLNQGNIYIQQYEFQKALEQLNQALEIDGGNEEVKELKRQTEEKIKVILENRIQADRCFKEGLYKEAVFYLNEILKIIPSDEKLRLQKEMSELFSLTEPKYFIRKSHQRFKPSEWLNVNYTLPSKITVFVSTSLILIVIGILINYVYRTQIENMAAEDIYQRLQQRISKREYYSATFYSDYQKLIHRYARTKYAKKAEKEFVSLLPDIEKGRKLLIQEYIREGKELLEQGKPKEALEAYAKVLNIEPFNREALFLINEAKDRIELKESTYTFASASEYKVIKPKISLEDEISKEAPPLVREYIERGQLFFDEDRFDEAIEQWEKAIAIVSEEDKKRLSDIIERVKDFSLQRDRQYNALFATGEELVKQKNYLQAIGAFREALKYKPDDPKVKERLTEVKAYLRTLYTPKIHSFKQELISKLTEVGDRMGQTRRERVANKFNYFSNKAKEEERANRFLKANLYYKKANKYIFVSDLIIQMKLNRMIPFLKMRLSKYPEDQILKITLGNIYYCKGWLEEADAIWEEVINEPQNELYLRILIESLKAKATEKKNNFFEAIKRYRDCLKLQDIYFVKNSLAKLLWQEGFYDEAVNYLEELQRTYPYQLDIINSLSYAYIVSSKQKELKELLKSIADITPFQLRIRQIYPFEVDPEYMVGVVSEREYFSQATYKLSYIYTLLGDIAESIRWNRIGLELESKL